MGLSIHYSGRIKDAASLPLLIDEVKEISAVYGWKYRILGSSFPDTNLADHEILQPIYGISFTPPESETVFLTFFSNGVLVCPTRVHYFGNSKDTTTKNYIYQISVKTQYAGVATHALIINLFKYLNEKYFTDFKMSDESQYWETGDENLLREKFKTYNALLDNFVLSLQIFPVEEGENLISYFDRLIEHINKLKNKP